MNAWLDNERRQWLAKLLVRIHLGWIIFDCVMSITILLTNLFYGTYHSNPVKTVELLQNFNNFLTVIIFHGVFVGCSLCFTWGSGKEHYDFLLASCCKSPVGAVFHLCFMAGGAVFLLYGVKEDFFCPWSQIPVHVELYSYLLRGLTVSIFGLVPFLAKLCVAPDSE